MSNIKSKLFKYNNNIKQINEENNHTPNIIKNFNNILIIQPSISSVDNEFKEQTTLSDNDNTNNSPFFSVILDHKVYLL